MPIRHDIDEAAAPTDRAAARGEVQLPPFVHQAEDGQEVEDVGVETAELHTGGGDRCDRNSGDGDAGATLGAVVDCCVGGGGGEGAAGEERPLGGNGWGHGVVSVGPVWDPSLEGGRGGEDREGGFVFAEEGEALFVLEEEEGGCEVDFAYWKAIVNGEVFRRHVGGHAEHAVDFVSWIGSQFVSVFCEECLESRELVVASLNKTLHGVRPSFLQIKDVVADVGAAKSEVDKNVTLFEDCAAGLQNCPGDRVRSASHGDVFCEGEFLDDPYSRPVATSE